jgi:hypothetical protein
MAFERSFRNFIAPRRGEREVFIEDAFCSGGSR